MVTGIAVRRIAVIEKEVKKKEENANEEKEVINVITRKINKKRIPRIGMIAID